MPLTPLGRQLRSVLTGLRNVTCEGSHSQRSRAKTTWIDHTRITTPPTRSILSAPIHDGPVRRQRTAATPVVAADAETVVYAPSAVMSEKIEKRDTLPWSSPFLEPEKWEPVDVKQPAKDCSAFNTAETMGILAKLGYKQNNASRWAEILHDGDVFEAANMLASALDTHGSESVPPSMIGRFLSRGYIPARVLRAIISQADRMFQARSAISHSSNKDVYKAFCNMTYHARKVWPAGIPRIARFLLDNLVPLTAEAELSDEEYMWWMTDTLNMAMRIIVAPTAIEPIKNNALQEAALVLVLQFMNSHSPTLQITRTGYRAVVLLQLAQRKTKKEQQWAEVKALSWPPWKDERTAMDQHITADDHGTSKAAATLLRMRSAGFRPLGWEEVAMIYAGWDVDGTPTIQTLTLLGKDGKRFRTGTAEWAGRITATRTAQEAWAAYLAYEAELQKSGTGPSDQEVHLALLKRLHYEDRRRSKMDKNVSTETTYAPFPEALPEMWPLFPGDVKEAWPLPSSTHLHTYTRSEIPSMHGFYQHMQSNGVHPRGYCLAYLLVHARNLATGLGYLKDSMQSHDTVTTLIDMNPDTDITNVEMPVYVAFIRLLCRFPTAVMGGRTVHYNSADAPALDPQGIIKGMRLSRRLAIACAIVLLRWRRPLHTPPYNAVMQTLARENIYDKLSGHTPNYRLIEFPRDQFEGHPDQAKHKGALTAYKLAWRVKRIAQDQSLDLDIDGFRALCHVCENSAFATWAIIHDHADADDIATAARPKYLNDALKFVYDPLRDRRLSNEFSKLVGSDATDSISPSFEGAKAPDFTEALQVPSFSLLHVYIRAQGWMADHDGMLQTVRWMHTHADELATRAQQARNAGVMMHRTFCALRVFLERSWLPEPDPEQHLASATMQPTHHAIAATAEEPGTTSGPQIRHRVARQLQRLRSPAPRAVLDEVRGLVESVRGWGGWPDDEAVERYHRANKRFARVAGGGGETG